MEGKVTQLPMTHGKKIGIDPATTTVGELIAFLEQFDPRQHFLTQAIMPDESAYLAPVYIFEVPKSECGHGLKYLGIQTDCAWNTRYAKEQERP